MTNNNNYVVKNDCSGNGELNTESSCSEAKTDSSCNEENTEPLCNNEVNIQSQSNCFILSPKNNLCHDNCSSDDSNCSESYSNPKLDLCMRKNKHKNKHSKSIIVNERKLVNKMIQNYYNPRSIAIKDNRCILKKLVPLYNNLIDLVYNFTDKICKLRHNINVTKSSKIFRVIYDSYKTLVYNYYKNFISILNIKYNGYDVLEYTINNIVSSCNNKINYASCNNFYETDNSLEKSALFYSVPGFTLLFNNDTLSFRIISKKSNCNTRDKISKYDFLLIPGNNNKCNRINKISFLKVLESIASFKNDRSNNILEFINFLYHESSNIKCLL